MRYSLYEAIYSKSDPMDLVDPSIRLHELADKFWTSPYGIHELDEYTSLMCEGDLLLEFSLKNFIKDNLVNVVQAGLGAVMGVVAPGIGDAIPDTIFFANSAKGFISGIKGFMTELGEMEAVIKKLMTIDISNSPQQIYKKVQNVINKLGPFFKKLGISIEDGIEKLKEIFRKLTVKAAKVAGDTMAIFIPIPGADALIQNGIVEAVESAHELMMNMYDKIPGNIRKLIQNPAELQKTLQDGVDSVIQWLEGFVGTDENKQKSLWQKAKETIKDTVKLGPAMMVLKKAGAFQKIIDWLKEKGKSAIDFSIDAITKIVPFLWVSTSSLVILLNDDHNLLGDKKTKKEESEKGDKSVYNDFDIEVELTAAAEKMLGEIPPKIRRNPEIQDTLKPLTHSDTSQGEVGRAILNAIDVAEKKTESLQRYYQLTHGNIRYLF